MFLKYQRIRPYQVFYKRHGLSKLLQFIGKRIYEYLVLPAAYRNMPRQLHIETTNFCNLRCSFCTLHDQMPDKQVMSYEQFATLSTYFKYLKEVRLSGIAEPLVNKHLGKYIQLIRQHNSKCNISLITNAMLLNEAFARSFITNRLDELSFSLESIDPAINDKIRSGSNLHIVLKNIQLLNQLKEQSRSLLPHISATVVLQRQNYRELPAIIEKLADFQIDTIHVNGLEPYTVDDTRQVLWLTDQQPEDLKDILSHAYDLATKHAITLSMAGFNPSPPYCPDVHTPLIHANGEVTPCSALTYNRTLYTTIEHGNRGEVQKSAMEKQTFGNVFEENLVDIWMKPEYFSFRERVIEGRFPASCKSCLIKHNVICRRQYLSKEEVLKSVDPGSAI